MSFQTPPGWASRCVFRDPTLPHQIKLLLSGQPYVVAVSCNCRGFPIGPVRNAEEAWNLYLDPANHRGLETGSIHWPIRR